MKKKSIIITLALILILSLAACSNTDVVGTESVNSFETVLNAMENNVAEDEMKGGWAITSPDGTFYLEQGLQLRSASRSDA